MEKTLTRAERVLAGVVLTVLTLFFCSVAVRAFTRLILVKKLGMDNAFTQLVLFDAPEDMAHSQAKIEWEKLYPFPVHAGITPAHQTTITEKYSSKWNSLKERIEQFVSEKLMGYYSFLESAKRYENIIEWNFTAMSEYNGVIRLPDGYLTGIVEKRDVSESANSVIALADFCKQRGIDFLYVNAPYKICRYEDATISGRIDFSNQNADEFLRQIAEADVKYYDLREPLHAEKMSHHGAFFRTDHHWLPETGLWASRHILQLLRDEYGYSVDPSVLDKDKFTAVNYPSWFLGSQGKKVMLARTEPEDINLLYPNYETKVRLVVPSLSLDITGDFSKIYDMSRVNEKDYYGNDPYQAYSYARRAVTRMDNLLNTGNEKKLCLIRESNSNAVIPFLSMGITHIDALDPDKFTGSIQNYIETLRPNIVIVLYNAAAISGPINWQSHTSYFDFR